MSKLIDQYLAEIKKLRKRTSDYPISTQARKTSRNKIVSFVPKTYLTAPNPLMHQTRGERLNSLAVSR